MSKLLKKRLISFALICMLTVSLLGTLSVGVSAAPASGELFNCDFSKGTADTATNVWSNLPGNGWTLYEENITVGNYKADNDNVYLECIGSGDSLVVIGAPFSTPVIDSGKLYVSFMYRRPLNAVSYVDIQIMNYVDGTSTPLYDNNEKKLGAMTLCRLADTMTLGTNNSVGDFSDNQWHSVGLVCDIDNGTVTGYIDGVSTETSTSITELKGGVNTLVMHLPAVSGVSANLDDFVINGLAQALTVSGSADYEDGIITATFNDPVVSTLTADKVSITKCGANAPATITDVSVNDGVVTVNVDKTTLEEGREYRLEFDNNVKTLFGNILPEIYFNVQKGEVITKWSGGPITNGVLDFEGLTVGGSNRRSRSVTSPTDFYNFIDGPRYSWGPCVDGSLEDTNNLTKKDGTSIGEYTNNNISKHAWRIAGAAMSSNLSQLIFGSDFTDKTEGTIVFEFDYLFSRWANAGAPSVKLVASDGSKYKIHTFTSTNTSWKHFKVSFDYAEKQAKVQIDNGTPTVLSAPLAVDTNLSGETHPTAFPESFAAVDFDKLEIRGYHIDDHLDFFVDNLTQYYIEEPAAAVESVRYVDVDSNRTGLDAITPDTKAIEIKFSKAVDESTLSAITLSPDAVTDRSYNSSTFTYTFKLDDLLLQNSSYTLTVPASVVGTEVAYIISTGNGNYKLRNPMMTIGGEEITDVSSLAGQKIKISVEQINTANNSGKITLIYCMYDENELVDVNHKTFNLVIGGEILDEGFTVKSGITPDEVRVLVWSGELSELKPALPAKIY